MKSSAQNKLVIIVVLAFNIFFLTSKVWRLRKKYLSITSRRFITQTHSGVNYTIIKGPERAYTFIIGDLLGTNPLAYQKVKKSLIFLRRVCLGDLSDEDLQIQER